ncbi:hypothetical protein ECL_B049 (plasmid) [Enterobacter cloacae subsp. cloacae ATCC 13047]|uniref:Uncharacterized protein n=1 Tax=Enterobacter cloacae subsp. cloacae (strain ATCC 13047 / DSM 30054 / NBRC 13535 / NCTC 10005 / WDCM 00083 / NCDC 279-56) TaxID=716541 RepID=A0A0H3CSZ8_ENTCC|nr:hypothetical protein ECL_B049 [Enterobacter cloacae subsp. cloacae ATCC 13047]OOC92346.1 hypothetical protein BWP06_03900 [Enterobacter cloacae]
MQCNSKALLCIIDDNFLLLCLQICACANGVLTEHSGAFIWIFMIQTPIM